MKCLANSLWSSLLMRKRLRELYIQEKIKAPEGEFIEGVTGIQRIIYGDNTAAISVASAPEGGAWR